MMFTLFYVLSVVVSYFTIRYFLRGLFSPEPRSSRFGLTLITFCPLLNLTLSLIVVFILLERNPINIEKYLPTIY
jgi:hypothetical protein